MKNEKKQTKITINKDVEKRSIDKVFNETTNFNHILKCNRLKPNMPEVEGAKKLKNK